MTLNYAKRVREVKLDAAIKRVFEAPFLPSVADMEKALGCTMGIDMTKQHHKWEKYLRDRPSRDFRDYDSYTAKYDLLVWLSGYKPPQKTKMQTKQDMVEAFDQELQQEGRFWTYVDPADLPDYDGMFGCVEEYVAVVTEYLLMPRNAQKLKLYREAGGTLA